MHPWFLWDFSFVLVFIGIIGFVTKYPHRIPGALRIIAFLADTCPDFIQHIPPRERVHVKWVHSVTMVIITRNVVLMGNQIRTQKYQVITNHGYKEHILACPVLLVITEFHVVLIYQRMLINLGRIKSWQIGSKYKGIVKLYCEYFPSSFSLKLMLNFCWTDWILLPLRTRTGDCL